MKLTKEEAFDALLSARTDDDMSWLWDCLLEDEPNETPTTAEQSMPLLDETEILLPPLHKKELTKIQEIVPILNKRPDSCNTRRADITARNITATASHTSSTQGRDVDTALGKQRRQKAHGAGNIIATTTDNTAEQGDQNPHTTSVVGPVGGPRRPAPDRKSSPGRHRQGRWSCGHHPKQPAAQRRPHR